MRRNTLKAHAEILKSNAPEKYLKFRQALVGYGEEVYFDNTLCRTRSDKPEYNLRQVRFIVADLICEFFPDFKISNFRENRLPELPIIYENIST